MAKLSDLRPGQKVACSPIQDKTQKLTGEIKDYVFLAVIDTGDGHLVYAHSDDIEVVEQPKATLSEEMKQAIDEQVQSSISAAQQGTAGKPQLVVPAAPAAPAAEWEEEAPADSTTAEPPPAE